MCRESILVGVDGPETRRCLSYPRLSGSDMEDATEVKLYTTIERLEDLKKWQESLFSLDLFEEPTEEQDKLEAWGEQKFSSTVFFQEDILIIIDFSM